MLEGTNGESEAVDGETEGECTNGKTSGEGTNGEGGKCYRSPHPPPPKGPQALQQGVVGLGAGVSLTPIGCVFLFFFSGRLAR